MEKMKNTGGGINELVNHTIARLMFKSSFLRRKIVNFGEIADFDNWVRSQFSVSSISVRREKLWELILDEYSTTDEIHCVEFGVAFGYLTQWWILQNKIKILKWDGFDRFTGLPQEWRFHERGAFDAGGVTPNLSDNRISWHVGDVQDTISGLSFVPSTRKLIFFDFDLFEPTLVAWEFIKESLSSGDVLYFDEAYAKDERLVLIDHILPNFKVKLIGSTTTALALKIITKK